MRVEAFDFQLPPDRIAQAPARPRDSARLLAVGADRLEDRGVLDLPELLRPGDLLVFNDTRVLPTRLTGWRGEARVEVTLYEQVDARTWRAFARPAKRLRPDDRLLFEDLTARVIEKGDAGDVLLAFDREGPALLETLQRIGQMPLPPYIKRATGGDPADRADYQTLFARRDGAIAAPTASLHFTDRLMTRLAARGVEHAFVTLHVGAGTFLPIKVEDTRNHIMHQEWYELPEPTAACIAACRSRGGRIVAAGTTVLRTLESVSRERGRIEAARGQTRLFLQPGDPIETADLLLTNFHLPRSTLFMLVATFSGLDRMRAAYAHAIQAGYRFYSYGDACLLERAR